MIETARVSLNTMGMHCRSCVMLIEMSVAELEGVHDVEVDLEKSFTTVDFDPDVIDVDSIIAEIEKVGYRAELVNDR